MNSKPTLYVVATPIGNLSDISKRALETLANVDSIYAEDTRQSAKLLTHYQIKKPLIALHKHNETAQAKQLEKSLLMGKNIALISDAGTPLIADPGASVIAKLRENHQQTVDIKVIPGCSSVVAALSISGLMSDKFNFAGFIPSQKKARENFLANYQYSKEITVFFETPHRIVNTLADFLTIFDKERHVFIARELTKTFEQSLLMTIDEAQQWIQADDNHQKGEFVLILDKSAEVEQKDWETLLQTMIEEGISSKNAANVIAKMGYTNKKTAYQAAIDLNTGKYK